jgi:hypothetical protein
MARFDKPTRRAIIQLVADTMIMGFDYKQVNIYLKSRLPQIGEGLSEREIDRIRGGLRSQPALQYWLSNQVKVGFLTKHKELIDEMELVRSMYWAMINKEKSKPEQEQKDGKITRLLQMVTGCNHRIAELNMASPIVAQMKAFIEISMQKGQQPVLPVPTNEIERSLQLVYNPVHDAEQARNDRIIEQAEKDIAVEQSMNALEGPFETPETEGENKDGTN